MSAPEPLWESGWDGHDAAQRKRMAALTFMEKLAWLEDAHRVALSLAGARATLVSDGKSAGLDAEEKRP